MKLHAALVLNVTYWVIYEPRRDTKRSGCSKGFNDRVSLIFFSASNPARKITLYRSKIKEKLQLNVTETQMLDFLGRTETVEIEI